MRVGVKICGVTRSETIAAAAAAGADAVGFVFAPSPRRLTAEEALRLARGTPPSLQRVGVLGTEVPTFLRELLEERALDLVQADAAVCEGLEAFVPEPRLLRVFRDTPEPDPALEAFLAAAAPARPMILFEGRASGQGVLPDWGRAARVARRAPLVLAGGLTPMNVGAAIARVRPAMVDVSSGVESAPGVKDVRRIEAFVGEVRAAEQRLAECEGGRR